MLLAPNVLIKCHAFHSKLKKKTLLLTAICNSVNRNPQVILISGDYPQAPQLL